MRNKFAETLYQVGSENSDIFIVVSDISPAGSMEQFRTEFPERFVNVGVAEQSMIGLCAGLALRGKKAFAYTIATFTIYRPFEFIRDDLCYQNLPVVLVGVGGGVTYSQLGGTHHAQEDIAVMGALPNMSIIAPCDPLEAEAATKYCASSTGGPVYLRLGKAGEPEFTNDAVDPFEFGKLRHIKRGTDTCIISYGPIISMAFEVASELEQSGKSVSIASCHTVKPLDREGIAKALHEHGEVIIIEEHSVVGGLASQTKAIAWEEQAKCNLKTFSLQDEFIHTYGSHDDVRTAHGLAPQLILEQLRS